MQAMNARERYISTVLFKNHDKPPFTPGRGRRSTIEAWRRQGLPHEVEDYHAYVCHLLGIRFNPTQRQISPGIDFLMIPQFEERILEHYPAKPGQPGPGTLIVQDWKGNICEISDEYDVSYLRSAIDFVTRRWIRCPVETRADWESMRTRYDVDHPDRFPQDYADRCRMLKERDYVSCLSFPGPFWQLLEWLGFENLCMLFLDDPAFVHELIAFWEDFVARLLERTFENYVPDVITVNEDMAYKSKPMIGPDMTRTFLLKTWKRWGDMAKAAGVPIYGIDSDGYVGDLIPVWIEAGFNLNSPQEVAAGNDLVAYLGQFGSSMAYAGGVDKRAMAAGGKTIKAEIERLIPAIKVGGLIPSCDHGIPCDVSWPNFVEYCRLLAQATGWLQ